MIPAIEQLTELADDPNRFDHSAAELYDVQIAALNERFQARRERIGLLKRRADEAGITAVGRFEDAVALLFPHSVYKSYPERFLTEHRWDRLGTWLGTLSSHPITMTEAADIPGIDQWIERLRTAGHYVSCSSGTTGKPAMLLASEADMAWSRRDTVNLFAWGSGVAPARDRRMMGIGLTASVPKNIVIGKAQQAAYGDPEKEVFRLPVSPLTVEAMTGQVRLRRKITDGTASPAELAAYERTSAQRQAELDRALIAGADAMIEHRTEKLYISGMWSTLYQVAALVRERGFGSADFHPDNCIYVGGGLKRAQLPADYRQFVYETFNIPPGREFQNYSMQELNSGMPKCQGGNRYHVPPWVVPFVLDDAGETLLSRGAGAVEGRAAFFDLSLDGRWGGIITGDRIVLDYRPCACGNRGPSIADSIVRYADMAGDDKIACAGTADAYVRGLA
ncbi:hypothetical protein [Nocardia flavorosea]|uniref:Uncharacterized protein n=1 Tax=Nocardia flavorosea TaxID=53429 RepID=A0A846YHI8_9NOCA|nr:hypothetical protein [Nocardia flavorosea]NKY59086.1 hypothetical protein [Nocardia flavorosea]